jgi:hypothetical protein
MTLEDFTLIEQNIENQIHKFVIPIYKIKESKIKLLGTGFYLKVESKFFIITAEHVLSETYDVFYADSMEHLSTIPYKYYKKQENIDLGLYYLKEQLKNFYVPFELDITKKTLDKNKYFLLGYPGTKSVYYNNKMHSALKTFITTKDFNPKIDVKEFELALSFTRQKTYIGTNERQRFPLPYGMSGGPVFTYQIDGNNLTYSLFGILTRYDVEHDKTLIATRIEFINELIRRALIEIYKHETR